MGRVIIYSNNSLMKCVAMLRCLCFLTVEKATKNKLLGRVIIHLNSSLMGSVAICLFVLLTV